MTSGIKWNADDYSDKHNTTYQMEQSKDWVKFILEQDMINEPGKKFNYKDGDTVLLGYIFEKLTGVSVDKYAKKYLFEPLDISAYWNKINGVADVEGGLYMSSKSLLSIGQLILHDGIYNNSQIISPQYLRKMIKNHKPNKDFFGYGFQWWLYKKVIFCWGYKGQYLVIIPDKKIIGIFNTETIIFSELNEWIKVKLEVEDKLVTMQTCNFSMTRSPPLRWRWRVTLHECATG